MGLCLLDGAIVPLAEARIDPLDRGFLFGDALYEVIKVVAGTPLHAAQHFERLRSGLSRIGIPEPAAAPGEPGTAGATLEAGLAAIVQASALGTGSVYLQVTRGAGPRAHAPPPDPRPTLLMLPREHAFPAFATQAMRATTLADPRWRHCDLKTTSLLANVLAIGGARAAGANEVLFVGPGSELREGGHTNVFVRHGEALETHPLDGRVLPGVTRALLVGLAAAAGLAVRERAPRLAERGAWGEAFLCGTYTGIQPLVALDGEPVGGGEPGPWTLRLAAELADLERRLAAA